MKEFLAGLGIGLAGSLLLAPAAGEATRRRIRKKVEGVLDRSEQRAGQAVQKFAEHSQKRAGEIGSRVGREAAKAAVKAVEEEVVGNKSGPA